MSPPVNRRSVSTRCLAAVLACSSPLAIPMCRRAPVPKSSQPAIPAARVPKPGMQLPFRKVARLGRPAAFVAYHEWLEHMDVSQDADLIKGIRLSQGTVRNAGIAVYPDCSGFYVGTKTALLQCDTPAKLVRRIPLPEFDLGGGEFIWETAMSDDYIWLVCDGGPAGSAIVEWRLDKPPATRLIVPVEHPAHIAVDRERRRVYVPFAGGVVNFNKAKFEGASWGRRGEYYFADFDSRRGLLLSSYPAGTTRTIVHVNPVTGDRNPVTDGLFAIWGPDDWIYFCVGDTELWRCKSDGSQREVVFTATEDKVVSQAGYACAPRFDQSRSRLAYTYYSAVGGGEAVSGIVLIDFATQEYRVLPNKYRCNVAWIVNHSQRTSQPSQP